MVDVHYFAAARAAAGRAQDTAEAATLGELLNVLRDRHTGSTEAGMSFAEVLERCTFLVDGASASEDAVLSGASRVDVLPPFAGG
ncbi:MoaD/ThiS family protein [Corynebacterium sp. YSMAA1_1_D6]|uniref:MoaD/ThiS family protein n=1 Tax=Corynebacterium sp. YSMAA1_1_D6 TaxID=3383589 RepID=UPI0038D19F50